MKKLYKENTAYYPRLLTDVMFADHSNQYAYNGFVDKAAKFIENFQLLNTAIWQRFTEQFTFDADFENGWRGEYWGKMMRGACLVYSYTKNEKLYEVLTKTVCDLISTADSDGRISTYAKSHEFRGWDMWCRKYVLLGLEYYLDICTDTKLSAKIISVMEAHTDYIISKIGSKEYGRLPITSTSDNWRGLNSSSILEPVVRLYSITKKQKYLDFAKYIAETGGIDVANLVDYAIKDGLYPYQYPVTKAYEMISYFEGILEYYRVTGEEKYKKAVIKFADKVLESDFTVIGCCGCTHELFDHSTVRQANTSNGEVCQETCVTVTMMKFMYQMLILTGNPKYADAFETSFYNAYLGSINTEKIIDPSIKTSHTDLRFEPLPFDSYSPLTAGRRGIRIGGLLKLKGGYYYGCCACIGAAGIGLVPKLHLLTTKNGFAMNMYINGSITAATPSDKKIIFTTSTSYPRGGSIEINLGGEVDEVFEIKLRNPEWSEITDVWVNGKKKESTKGYICLEKHWRANDKIEISFDMRTKVIHPIPYGSQVLMNDVCWEYNYVVPFFDKEDPKAKNHIALRRGPLMLSQDNRLGYSVDDAVSIAADENGYADAAEPTADKAPYEHIAEFEVLLKDGSKMTVTDYASAGKLWSDESKMAVWIKTV